ncbi:hypothetical protein AVEN_270704-1 [Araneus ventricosus]|uniref:Transposase Tc1-like domain-containing protein n=1 Tax=Araneus ventricosus TaxID=182803 RepID=A0A4Y2FGR8_ARAVE|nr:hypothetical protein AVEN_270704-1 [Araneus ventricosus]
MLLFSSPFIIPSFQDYGNNSKQLSEDLQTVVQGLRPPQKIDIAVVAKRNRRSTSTRVTSMVAAAIDKTMSATTARRRLHMNGLYARVPRVCVPLSVQSRGARLKWCRQHVNWTVSDVHR